MNNCINCQKKFIEKTIVSVMDIKSKEIEAVLHLSKSVVSRHMTGEKNNIDVDIYIIEKAFGIKIKDYSIKDFETTRIKRFSIFRHRNKLWT